MTIGSLCRVWGTSETFGDFTRFIEKPENVTAGKLLNVSQYISLQELRDRQRDEAGAQIFNTHRASGFSYRAKVPPDGAVSA